MDIFDVDEIKIYNDLGDYVDDIESEDILYYNEEENAY